MNILLLGAAVLSSGFQELGHSVVTCTTDGTGQIDIPEFPTSIQCVLQSLPKHWSPDCILLTDDSTYPMFVGLEEIELPLGWYAIDSHLHHGWHRGYAAIFDCLFVAQRDYVPQYVRDPERQSVQWLPLCTFPVADLEHDLPKQYDLSFVGNIHSPFNPERRAFIEAVHARYPLHLASGEFVSIFTQSKMVLNQCVANDVNFRTFEAMACGSLLLMERVGNGLEELFQDEVHLVLYEKGNVDQVIELADYYATHDHERETITRAGQQEVRDKHTYVHRAQAILSDLFAGEVDRKIQQRRARLEEIRFVLSRVFEYVSALYDSQVSRVAQDSMHFRDLSVIRDKFRSWPQYQARA